MKRFSLFDTCFVCSIGQIKHEQIIKEIKKQLDEGSHHLMIENIPSGTVLV